MTQDSSMTMTGVILAGGRAQRMGGQDKGLLLLAGQPMAAHVISRLRPQVGELLINANRHESAYQQLGCAGSERRNDHFLGPLAGMLAAISATANPYVLSVPCDSPLLPIDYAQRMYA
ncbi:MAG: NTP transferase domain-containing protein, partial [Candidatus Competibacteraceae bacterium]|nr:NTP transferase domain-containing protein [Candidatus Competibacteraceae bacterium]